MACLEGVEASGRKKWTECPPPPNPKHSTNPIGCLRLGLLHQLLYAPTLFPSLQSNMLYSNHPFQPKLLLQGIDSTTSHMGKVSCHANVTSPRLRIMTIPVLFGRSWFYWWVVRRWRRDNVTLEWLICWNKNSSRYSSWTLKKSPGVYIGRDFLLEDAHIRQVVHIREERMLERFTSWCPCNKCSVFEQRLQYSNGSVLESWVDSRKRQY